MKQAIANNSRLEDDLKQVVYDEFELRKAMFDFNNSSISKFGRIHFETSRLTVHGGTLKHTIAQHNKQIVRGLESFNPEVTLFESEPSRKPINV